MGAVGTVLSHIPKGKLFLVGAGAVGVGTVALLRKLAVGGGDGAYNGAGAGLSGVTGYDGSSVGTVKNVGFTLAHPLKSAKNTAWAVLDAATLHKLGLV